MDEWAWDETPQHTCRIEVYGEEETKRSNPLAQLCICMNCGYGFTLLDYDDDENARYAVPKYCPFCGYEVVD